MNKDHGNERAEAELRWGCRPQLRTQWALMTVLKSAVTQGGCDWIGGGGGGWGEGGGVVILNLGGVSCAMSVLAGRVLLALHIWVSEHLLALFNGTSGHLIYTSYLAGRSG